jgi:integrase
VKSICLTFSRSFSTVVLQTHANQMKTWQKTRLQNLLKHKSGRYYARAFAGGKEIWRSLDTSHFSVAQARLAEFLKDHRERYRNSPDAGPAAKMTFGEAAVIHLQNLNDNRDIKESTRHYWRQCLASLVKSWPKLNETEVRRISKKDCEAWAKRYRKTSSPVRFNNTVAILQHVFNVAIDAGVIYRSPARTVKRAKLRGKKISLPPIDKFNALLDAMRNGGGRHSPDCADLAAGLAFTGCRLGEASEIAWLDLDFITGKTRVRGHPETGTKSGAERYVPWIPDARALFERMRGERTLELPDAKVFRVRECQKSMDRAAKKVGIDRITHHDLRHLFATRCIESGVDIPTVSRWLGHSDGGALLMKTYGHLRDEHSTLQATRVTFGHPQSAKNVVQFKAGSIE